MRGGTRPGAGGFPGECRELRIARYDCALMKSMGIDYSELRDVCWLYQEHQLLQDLRLEMMNLEVVPPFLHGRSVVSKTPHLQL